MKIIKHAHGTLETADDIADAITVLDAALGRNGLTALMEIPMVRDDGKPLWVDLVLGSQVRLTTERPSEFRDAEPELHHVSRGLFRRSPRLQDVNDVDLEAFADWE